jgi:glucan 1,3-beta-glucosidase
MGPLLGDRTRTELQIVEIYDAEDVRNALEKHYSDWMCEADFNWLRDHGFNTIRVGVSDLFAVRLLTTTLLTKHIQVPYWALIGINETIISAQHRNAFLAVYGRAWEFLLEKIEMAGKFGFGVLVGQSSLPWNKQRGDIEAPYSSTRSGWRP